MATKSNARAAAVNTDRRSQFRFDSGKSLRFALQFGCESADFPSQTHSEFTRNTERIQRKSTKLSQRIKDEMTLR